MLYYVKILYNDDKSQTIYVRILQSHYVSEYYDDVRK